MVMMVVKWVKETNLMRMNVMWAEMEEWMWKDEMMEAHFGNTE